MQLDPARPPARSPRPPHDSQAINPECRGQQRRMFRWVGSKVVRHAAKLLLPTEFFGRVLFSYLIPYFLRESLWRRLLGEVLHIQTHQHLYPEGLSL